MEADHERAGEATNPDFLIEHVQEACLGRLVQLFKGFGATAGLDDLPNPRLDEATERLDQIIGQAEGVIPIAVVDAEGGQEPCAAEGAGHSGAQNHVAIVEQIVGRGAVWVTAEFEALEEGTPVEAGSAGFDVGRVTASDLRAEQFEGATGARFVPHIMSLVGNLGLYELLPQSLFEGFGGADLVTEPFGLQGVGLDRQEQAGGMVVVPTQNNGGPGRKKLSEHGVGIGHARMVDEQNADVLTGDADLVATLAAEKKLTELDG